MFEFIKGFEGSTLGFAREPSVELSYEDVTAVRMRETPARGRVGRYMSGGSYQRYLPAADFVSTVSKVSTLLPAEPRPLQGQIAEWSG